MENFIFSYFILLEVHIEKSVLIDPKSKYDNLICYLVKGIMNLLF